MSWLVWLKQFAYKYLGGYEYDGSSTYYDDILEFDPLTWQWELVDRMIQAREFHAVSVINFESEVCFESWFNKYCREMFYDSRIDG